MKPVRRGGRLWSPWMIDRGEASPLYPDMPVNLYPAPVRLYPLVRQGEANVTRIVTRKHTRTFVNGKRYLLLPRWIREL